MGVLSVDFNNINLDDVNFVEDDPEIIIHVGRMAWCNKFKQRIAFKKELSKELMPVAWHPRRWWDWCMRQDEKKEIKSFFIDEM